MTRLALRMGTGRAPETEACTEGSTDSWTSSANVPVKEKAMFEMKYSHEQYPVDYPGSAAIGYPGQAAPHAVKVQKKLMDTVFVELPAALHEQEALVGIWKTAKAQAEDVTNH
ncbi:hypothetical protein AOLI_G00308540 [Acnodon oligacanthus]